MFYDKLNMVIPMNETIGVKGGASDRKRMLVISQNQKKKLEEEEEKREIAELEKKVKKKQFYTLIKTLPIVIGGGTIQTLYDTATGKKRDTIEDENSKWRIKEYDHDVTHMTPEEFQEKKRRKIITTPTGEKIVVYVSVDADKDEVKDDILDPIVQILEPKDKKKEEPQKPKMVVMGDVKDEKKEDKKTTKSSPKVSVGIGDEELDLESFIDKELSTVDFPNLSPEAKDKLEKLKSRKIVDEYEKQLKDIRFELRKVIYEYNVLVDENEEVVLSRDAEIILERLSDIIDKIEELKRKIKIEDLDKYDDNYIYFLIEGYLQEFHDKRVIDEIKDSPLYIMLSEKLDELEQKRGKFSQKVEEKKERFEDREEEFDRLKDRYYSIEQLNNQLLEFQYDQNRILKEIQEKVRNATTESERVQEEVVGLSRQSRRLLNLMTFQMFLPGPRFAKGLAASVAAYLHFMNNVIKPHTKTTKYKVIMVKDYHNDIKDSISAIDDALRLLGKTSEQIDKMIIELEDRYKDYLGNVYECDQLLQNLRKVKREVEEKEYEMNKIKKQQELELEKNDAKVKTMGEYPVN